MPQRWGNVVLTWVLIAVGVVVVVVKRFVGEPLSARDLFVPPLVLIGIGVHSLWEVHLTALDVVWVVAGSVVGVGLGAARGATVKVFTRDGVLWQRYTPWTLAAWAGSLVVNFGMGWAATATGTPADARPITLSIGVGLLGELAPIGLRALRSGTPFACS